MFTNAKRLILGAAALIAMSVTVANATPITWYSSVNPSDFQISGSQSYSYSHSITGGSNGYQPSIDSITSAALRIWLYDDAFFGDAFLLGDSNEYVNFTLDFSNAGTYEVDGNFLFEDSFNFSLASLLSADGNLNVTLTGKGGDFVFDRSELVVHGNDAGATGVPEPASLALFGLGMLGIGLAGKRKGAKAA